VAVSWWPVALIPHLSGTVNELLAVDTIRRPTAVVALQLFDSYRRFIDPDVGGSLLDDGVAMPPYSRWKWLSGSPERFDDGCHMSQKYQSSGNTAEVRTLWTMLADPDVPLKWLSDRQSKVLSEHNFVDPFKSGKEFEPDNRKKKGDRGCRLKVALVSVLASFWVFKFKNQKR
jgi:hypothetical protein